MTAANQSENQLAGQLLIEKFNCKACHAASESQAKWLSPMRAPILDDIGNRASAQWLTKFLSAPDKSLPGTRMPDVLHGLPDSEKQSSAESLTHYLLSKKRGLFKQVMPDRAAVTRGEKLFHEVGCMACHAPQNVEGDQHAFPVSAPLPRMSEKYSFEGLRRFLLDPLACRPSGLMPSLKLTDNEATDISHYLLRNTRVAAAVELSVFKGRIHGLEDIDGSDLVVSRTSAVDSISVDPTLRDRGTPMRFTSNFKLEEAGEYTFYLSASGASRLAVSGGWIAGEDSWNRQRVDATVKKKLNAGWHAIKVDYVHRGNQQPSLKLEWEGPGITRQVIPSERLHVDRDEKPAPAAFVVDATKSAAGKLLYEQMNCAACHETKPMAKAPMSLAKLGTDAKGCLADRPDAKVPAFKLSASEQKSIIASIIALNRADLTAPTDRQRIEHSMALLNCVSCHARDGIGGVAEARNKYFTSSGEDLGDEGRIPPKLDGVGNKLKVAWLDKVLAQGGSVRPYYNTRMPQFGKDNIGHLAAAFVAVDRQPEPLPTVPDNAVAQKEAGRKMVGTDGGLSCIACHQFNRQPAQTMQIIDLASASERLNEDWFSKFMLDPNRFHPGTRMPAFWPDGKSPLPSLLDGNTNRQLSAIWTYLADGPAAKFPAGLSRQNVEIVIGGEAYVYRGKLWEAGFRAVAVGYPGQRNLAFDAEEMRLSLLWKGRFLNAAPHWQSQGMGQIRPLGTDVFIFPHGSPMAVLSDEKSAWPKETSKELGMKFRGYQLDTLKRPTLLYSFNQADIEDFLEPIIGQDNIGTGFHRTLKFTGTLPTSFYFCVARGNITTDKSGSYRVKNSMSITIKSNVRPVLRGSADEQELLLPVNIENKTVEINYVW